VAEAERGDLVEQHLGLVRAIATQTRRSLTMTLDLEDMVAYGMTGLLEAAERFDPRFNVTFATFSYHRIRGAIYDGLRLMGQIPRSAYTRARAAQRANEYLENVAERERGKPADAPSPTVEEDLRAIHATLSNVTTIFLTSLEAAAEQGMDLADVEQLPADEVAIVRQVGARLRTAVETLPEKERHFITKHYFEGKTLLEAGEELGMSKSWASRLHARAVEKLREALDLL
jgi:RNA polymerase sigma factor FliA